MAGLLELALGLTEILRVADEKRLLAKKDFETVARKFSPKLEFSADDWIWKEEGGTAYPSETASIALIKRDPDGNIIRAGIAALYSGFPIVVADETGCYLYKDGGLVPVVSVDRTFADDHDPEIPIRCHIFGQKSTPHWVRMNGIIGFLNEREIRTDNNMGPYFVLRNFLFHYRVVEGGIEIVPMKAVISEPYCNKPKEEIGAFIIEMLNQRLSAKDQLFLSDMSGEKLFRDGKMERVASCDIPYCASGWTAGTSEGAVRKVLLTMKEAVEINPPPDLPEDDPSRVKIEKLIKDLSYLQA